MSGNVLPPADLGSVTTNGVGDGSQSNPYVYVFTTANGLEMGTYNIYNNTLDNKHVRLDLNGGSISGSVSATAFDLKANGNNYTADLDIQNVGDIRIGKIWTYFPTYNDAGPGHRGGVVRIGTNTVSGRAGKVEIAEILTYAANAYQSASCGNVSIYGNSDVLIWDGVNSDDIDAGHPSATSDTGVSGSVTVWHDGVFQARDIKTYNLCSRNRASPVYLNGDILGDTPSGACTVNSVDTHACGSGDGSHHAGAVTVLNYTAVTVSNEIAAYNTGTYGYNNGHYGGAVLISGITGDISVGGTIQTYARGDSSASYAGTVTLSSSGGNVTVAGDIVANANDANAGAVTITAAGSVSLAGVDTRVIEDSAALYGGNLSATAAGNILIDGAITLDQVLRSDDTYDGTLTLTTTSADSTIQVNSLDLSKVKTATFSSGSAQSTITNEVLNFPTNTPANGKLNAVIPQKIRYDITVAANAYLTNGYSGVFTLQNGGLLTHNQTAPEVDNVGASNITYQSATLWGWAYTGAAPTTVWVYWGTNSAAWENTNSLGVCDTGYVTQPISGLTGDTTYYYRFYASNSVGEVWASTTNSFDSQLRPYDFLRKMKITFTGYTRSEPLTNFPALVVFRTDMTNGFAYDQVFSPSGWDLYFRNDQDTSYLNHEIEQWNTTTNSYVWVQVPIFTNNCYIWAYWGDTSRTSAPAIYTTNGATWTAGYSGVWHLKETSGSHADSTSNGLTGTPYNAVQQDETGVVDGADDFDGVDDSIGVATTPALTQYTAETWIYAHSLTNGNADQQTYGFSILAASPTGNYSLWLLGREESRVRLHAFSTSSTVPNILTDSSSISTGAWYHVVATAIKSGACEVFVNGISRGTGTSGSATWPQTFTIGDLRPDRDTGFDGRIDEVRLSSVVRSSNWIWACWMTVASNGVFNGYGEAGYSGLPWVEPFEDRTNGVLHAQNEWQASPESGAEVVTDIVYAGSRAGKVLGNADLWHDFPQEDTTNVWIDFYMRPGFSVLADPTVSGVKPSVAFYVTTNGYIRAVSNDTWVTLDAYPIASNEWYRFTMNLDYGSSNWSIYAADSVANRLSTPVSTNLKFSSSGTNTMFHRFQMRQGWFMAK